MSEESKTYTGESFVYEDKEVIKTGRTASKSKTTRGKTTTKVLVEVCPLSMIDKPSSMYHKWVLETELFTIAGTKIKIGETE